MAVSYIGASNLIATNGTAPGAITPHVNTATNDLLIFYHYSRATGGNETVAAPGGQGWTQLFQSVTINNGLVAVFWKIRQVGDTTSTFTVTNHTTGNSGETILEWIETYRGHHPTTPIAEFTATLSTWASSLTLGAVAVPANTTVHPGDAVVVFAGRFENVTAQTLLTGDGLTWAAGVRNDSTLGLDAGAVTQYGLNSSGSNQTITAKSITTTGTAQAGAGRMFIIEQENLNNISGTPTGLLGSVSGNLDNTDPVYDISGTPAGLLGEVTGNIDNTDPLNDISGTVTGLLPSVSGNINNVPPGIIVPQILGTTKGTDGSDLTTHTVTLPSGILNGELLLLLIVSNGTPTIASPSGWRGTSQASGGMTSRVCYRYATGEESISPGTITFTTTVAERCSWIALRLSKKSVIQHHHFATGTATTAVTNATFKGSSVARDILLLNFLGTNLDALPTGASTSYTVVDSQVGDAAAGCSAWIEKREFASTADVLETPSALTLDVSSDYASRMMSVAYVQDENEVFGFWHDHGNTGADLSSVTPLKGIGQSFVGNGARIERIGVNMRRSAAVTGTLTLKIYAASGKYGGAGSVIPTGTALATATTTIDPSAFSTTIWQYEEFIFNTPFRTKNNEVYVFTVECADISGGNIRIARAGSTTGKGNGSTSADLITWSATAANDYVHFIQFIKHDSAYVFITDFDRGDAPTNTDFDGLEALEEHPHISSVGVTSNSATYAIQEFITVDGKKVWHGKAVNDDPATTTTVERAQISVSWYDQPEQDAVYHFRTIMKFGPDLEFLRLRTNGIGIGYPDWIDFYEIWLQLYSAFDGDTAGAARWNINLHKAAGADQPYTWYLKGEKRQPAAESGVDFWNASNSSIAVQLDKWFVLDVYMKVGEGVNGRTTVKIKYEGEAEQTLFDVTDTTLYYEGYPQIKLGSFNPLKVYTSDAVMDYMAANSKSFSHYISEFAWIDDVSIHTDLTTSFPINGLLPSASGSVTNTDPVYDISGSVEGLIGSTSGTLDNTDPVYNLSGSLNGLIGTTSGTLTNTDPVYNVSGAVSGLLPAASGTLTNTDPVYNISGTLNGLLPTTAGTLTNTDPVYNVSGTLAGLLPSTTGTVTVTDPDYQLSGNVNGLLPVTVGNIDVANPGFNISGNLTGLLVTTAGTVDNTDPVYDLTGSVVGLLATTSGLITNTDPGLAEITLDGAVTGLLPAVTGVIFNGNLSRKTTGLGKLTSVSKITWV